MTRVERLERSVRRARAVAAAAAIGLLATWVAGATARGTSSAQETVRTRLLVVEDSHGRERIVVGAPMPDNQTRARMFLMLDSAGAASVQFLEWPDTQRILVRQLGFSRDTVVEWER